MVLNSDKFRQELRNLNPKAMPLGNLVKCIVQFETTLLMKDTLNSVIGNNSVEDAANFDRTKMNLTRFYAELNRREDQYKI